MTKTHIEQLIEDFRADLRVRRSEQTTIAYGTALNHFLAFVKAKEIEELTCNHPVEFTRWLQEHNPVSLSALRGYLSAISQFYRWLLLEDKAAFDLTEYTRLQERLADIRGGRRPDPMPKLPNEESVQAVLKVAREAPPANTPLKELRRVRDLALVEALRSTGARVSEVVALTRGDLVPGRQAAIANGKGCKERIIYFDDEAWEALSAYLEARGDIGLNNPIFCAHYRRDAESQLRPLNTDSVRNVLIGLSKQAGLQEALTPHQFRHRFGTRVLEGTGNLAITQDLLGHASPTTTRIYAKLAAAQIQAGHQQADL